MILLTIWLLRISYSVLESVEYIPFKTYYDPYCMSKSLRNALIEFFWNGAESVFTSTWDCQHHLQVRLHRCTLFSTCSCVIEKLDLASFFLRSADSQSRSFANFQADRNTDMQIRRFAGFHWSGRLLVMQSANLRVGESEKLCRNSSEQQKPWHMRKIRTVRTKNNMSADRGIVGYGCGVCTP